MRIAQVAPLFESVPPKFYGGTERIVSYLTDELVRKGHDVTLFASGDSTTLAKLEPIIPQAMRLDELSRGTVREPASYQMLALGRVFDRAAEFDVIHCHVEYFALPFTRLVRTPIVSTLHARLDLPELQAIFSEYRDAYLVSVSENQRKPVPYANWVANVYNGIDLSSFKLERRRGSYLAFLGRISPEKGLEQAIEVARRTGIPLKIAAKVDRVDGDYYEANIKPLLDGMVAEFVGEISQDQKSDFLGRSLALLFPIHWPEPFGLVMAEALACGKPVIAGRSGSVPEIIVEGKTGFICDSIEEMVLACQRVGQISPNECRQHVENHLSCQVMADAYEKVYSIVIGTSGHP